ncbi:MAG: HEPN domain-containing protein, partial [Thermoproteota archaeon]
SDFDFLIVVRGVSGVEGRFRIYDPLRRVLKRDVTVLDIDEAAEKALKALLLNFGRSHRGHDLLELRDILKTDAGLDVASIEKELRELTIHYTVSRYPNAANALPADLYDREKAHELVERARRVVEWVKQYLH